MLERRSIAAREPIGNILPRGTLTNWAIFFAEVV
jgi:hypothetical protein